VRDNNLIFLNEVGVDPGIDHIGTMKIVNECAERNEKILEYESWCGGLPSPQFCDNPLGYKFSWSPIGSFLALNNDAKFLKDGKEISLSGADLQYYAKPIDINQLVQLDGYPNRNSCLYKELYNLKDCHSLVRGTLRCSGFSQTINALKSTGLFNNLDKPKTNISFLNFFQN
jgi:saccharopine dehydrogenase-like NADP-dependent oxidoreductase